MSRKRKISLTLSLLLVALMLLTMVGPVAAVDSTGGDGDTNSGVETFLDENDGKGDGEEPAGNPGENGDSDNEGARNGNDGSGEVNGSPPFQPLFTVMWDKSSLKFVDSDSGCLEEGIIEINKILIDENGETISNDETLFDVAVFKCPNNGGPAWSGQIAAGGKVTVSGLEKQTAYCVTETNIPEGYTLVSIDPSPVEIGSGICTEIYATITNNGNNMAGPTNWELYWIASGNPKGKGGTVIYTGGVGPLAKGESAVLAYNPQHNPNGPAGNYMFKAYQRPGHPGKGVLWSKEITCGPGTVPSVTITNLKNLPAIVSLSVTKSATGFREKQTPYSWDIEKSVTPESITLGVGETENLAYTLHVTRTKGETVKKTGVRGEICVTNTGTVTVNKIKIEDQVKGSYFGFIWTKLAETTIIHDEPLEPGETVCIPYELSFSSTHWKYKNIVTVTPLDEDGNPIGEGDIAKKFFSMPNWSSVKIDETATVTDLPDCPTGFSLSTDQEWPVTVSGSTTLSYEVLVTNVNAETGSYELENTATLTPGDTQTSVTDKALVLITVPTSSIPTGSIEVTKKAVTDGYINGNYNGSGACIKIEKSGPASANAGDTISYAFTVTNCGDVDLFDVTVTDPHFGGGWKRELGVLNAGNSTSFAIGFTISADAPAGNMTNAARVIGYYECGYYPSVLFVEDGGCWGTPQGGVTFKLYKGGNLVAEGETDADGKLRFDDLDPGDDYELVEVVDPTEYTSSQSPANPLTVHAGETTEVCVLNTPRCSVTDEDDHTVTVQRPAGETTTTAPTDTGTTVIVTAPASTIVIEKVVLGGAEDSAIFTMNVAGTNYSRDVSVTAGSSVTLSGLQLGSYTITEINIPDGYELVSISPDSVNLTSNGQTVNVTVTNKKVGGDLVLPPLPPEAQPEPPGKTVEIPAAPPGVTPELPRTGSGSFILMGLGGLLAGTGMLLKKGFKRKKKDAQK